MRLFSPSLYLAGLVTAFFFTPAVYATNYYLSPSGSDSNSGTSQSQAWQTTAKVSNFNFLPGDNLSFEGGATFNGGFTLTSSDAGTSTSPVTVNSYGTGRAIINGGASYGIRIDRANGIAINNLKVLGSCNPLTNSGNNETGIKVTGSLTYSRISHVEVSNFCKEGILFNGGVTDGQITYSNVHDNAFRGIASYGAGNQNIYVAYNKVYNNPGHSGVNSGDGIRLRGVNGGTVEYNVSYNNGQLGADSTGGPVGIWTYESTGVVIQYNEAYGNRSSGYDGGGFDLDGGTKNSILQYNYSHENKGAGYLLAQYSGASTYSGNTIRYNISQNDGNDANHGGIHFWNAGSGITNTQIYNNIIYSSPRNGRTGRAVWVSTGGVSNVGIRNNIFITNDNDNDTDNNDVRLVDGSLSGVRFEGNLYHDVTGTSFHLNSSPSLAAWRTATGQEILNGSPVGAQADPKFLSVGNGGTIGDPLLLPTELPRLAAYYLQSTSPAISTGLNLQQLFAINPGSHDFFNTSVPQFSNFDIGAHEYNGATPPPIPTPSPSPSPFASSTPASSPKSGTTPTPAPTPTPGIIAGDVNGDGRVDLVDYNSVFANYGSPVCNVSQGDLDSNCVVNIFDINIVISNFGH